MMVQVGITQAAKFLDREPGTLRKWERDKVLPDDLLPKRDDQNRRYWSQEQLDTIKQWLIDTDRRPGKGHRAPLLREKERWGRRAMAQRSNILCPSALQELQGVRPGDPHDRPALEIEEKCG